MRTKLLIGFLGGVLCGIFAQSQGKKLEKRFFNERGKKPPGYTHVVTSSPGKMIFISGRGGERSDGTLPPDFKTQAENTFEDLKRCLALGGASFKDIVKINYYLKNTTDTTVLRQVRSHYLDMDHPPASTLVHTGFSEGPLLEVEAIAMVPE